MGDIAFEVRMFTHRLINFPRNLKDFRKLPRFKVGDIYLDCGWHPVVATEVTWTGNGWLGPWDWDLAGVSLLDGSSPRSCSVRHCAPVKIDYSAAEHIVALMLDVDNQLDAALKRRKAGVENIRRIYEVSPELQGLWG